MTPSQNIVQGLKTGIFGKKIFTFETIDSTNTCARLLAESGVEEGTVVYAEEQSAGRGRLKRKWHSTKGENLLFSVIFTPDFKERRYYLIPLLAAVAIIEGIRKCVPACPVVVKWPNDILLESGEKIGGILTEFTRTYDGKLRVIAGIGLNVNQTRFPENLKTRASSIQLSAGKKVDRFFILREILSGIEKYYNVLQNPDKRDMVVERWRSYCTMFNKPVSVQLGAAEHTGICRDIDDDGALLIENKNGEILRIVAGDVTSVAFNS